MKKIFFTKMVGAGNDFIILDEPNGVKNFSKLALKICDRKTGLGADGLLTLSKSRKTDCRMRIFNADGSEAEMCGNGARCMASYIIQRKLFKKEIFGIETLAGVILAKAKGEIAHIRLSDPKDYQPDVSIIVNKRKIRVNYIDTGVPHAIIFVEGLHFIDVQTIGRVIRYHKRFAPRGTNVSFVEQLKNNLVELRTYERGVEAETLACGTGSVAAAIISFIKSSTDIHTKRGVTIKVLTASSEILEVSFEVDHQRISEVWLKGSAKFIARGEYYV